ncbi:ATP-binding cassette domain-containing protein [Allorhizobium borbori]|uniref:Peptide/nickel transport system ATP-binding protein n=1 Tax=Allorhizobium borbori TaxID=485907 RepID=A0A7W6NZ90_9HYPH|nr:ABC transporter ATP-binding protein [Allorhizobium borbori]MBB4101497.1 peptide/nickel transport system ATP-binding protein [Allorhizobium borbori]
MTVLCDIRQLAIRYPHAKAPSLDHVSLTLQAGERLAVIGESGSGKSTFARALAGLLPPGVTVSGEIVWPSFAPAPLPGRDLGFVFQDPGASLNPVLTIGEQVAEGAKRHLGLNWKQAFVRAADLLERVRLPEPERLLRAFPHQLSGGQRQRVAIAAAVAARPSILVADEVTSALDQAVQAEIVALLDDLVREEAMTLVFITHDMALASTLADRIAVFAAGRLQEIGPVRQVVGHPQSVAAKTLLEAHIDLETPSLVVGGRP